ncbi:GTPase [Microbacterium sp. CFBP9034]|uniref:GTPase n=1 Tax=Microbacterium sp. CFBP9034 TaxID=3096540 RepID=UPI002A6AF54A|nr:GTPase [Microbacterium sp. CFBP9034]MDY0910113.1 GTPase [Microbacterium sp. CFBP9034]
MSELDDEVGLEAAIEDEAATERANIALFGATGAGKSTLLNAIFGAPIAKTGVGEPVTSKTELFVNDAGTLAIYDGEGLELGKKSPLRDIRQRINRNRKAEEALIHVVWYCVNSQTGRLEDGQRRIISDVAAQGIPVVLVLTKVSVRDGVIDPAATALADAIVGMNLPIVTGRPILTSAVDDSFNGVGRHGLESLLEATYRVIPEAQQIAIAAAQKIDLSIKARYARSWIAGAVAFAGGVGAAPIPLADVAVLIPAQAALLTKIAAIYDVPKAKAAKLVSAGTVAAAAGGKLAAGSLVKLVPGVGSVISAGVAATITGVLGESWRATMELVFTGKLDLDDADQLADLARFFTTNVKQGSGAPTAPDMPPTQAAPTPG